MRDGPNSSDILPTCEEERKGSGVNGSEDRTARYCMVNLVLTASPQHRPGCVLQDDTRQTHVALNSHFGGVVPE